MKASQAFILAVALLASGPLYADTTPAPVSGDDAAALEAAPSSATAPQALMLKAFRRQRWTCEASAPGTLPMLEPAARSQAACTISPFKHDPWGLCPAFPPSPVLPLPPDSPRSGQQQAFIVGDQIDAIQQGVSQITGKAQLDQGDHRVEAQNMIYDSNKGLAYVKQDVNYYTPQLFVTSPTGTYDTNKGFGTFDDADFFLPLRHGHGTAKLVNSLDSDHSQLFGVQYTTCPPGKPDWTLNAPDLSLDTATNTGEGHDVTIEFLGLPVFWTPYINFPISAERKSGFLSAEFSFDAVNGIETEAPYYLNLAPNYDATLYPRIISKRGIQMGGAFQLLTPISYDYIYASYLPHDMLADRDRGQLVMAHRMELSDSLRMSSVYNWISDDNLFHDLNSDLPITSSTYLERFLSLQYSGGLDLGADALVQDYQVIDPAIRRLSYPYRRIPSLGVSWGNFSDVSGPEYQLGAELVRFQRANRLGAWRLDAEPSISLPLSGSSAFLIPTLAWRYSRYDLGEQRLSLPAGSPALVGNPLLDDSSHPMLSVPIFSINTGLYFDRDAGDYLQTLEPQLYYLRVPFRDQSKLPNFDSSGIPFNFNQLFNNNSFFGADRQADANQLSYALTSRFLDPNTGAEILRGDVGQIRYFSDRKVNPSGVTQTALFSDIAADIVFDLDEEWTAGHEQLWSPITRRTDLGNVLLQYHPGYHQVVNIGYQYQAKTYAGTLIKQTDFSYSWPLAGNWSSVGRWNYDIIHHVTLEDFVGLEYDNCCWNFQILHRHVIVGRNEYDNVFFFQLSLKGLVTAGRHLDDLVENGILGYQNSSFTQSQQIQPP